MQTILMAHASKLLHVHPEDDGITVIIVSAIIAICILSSWLISKKN